MAPCQLRSRMDAADSSGVRKPSPLPIGDSSGIPAAKAAGAGSACAKHVRERLTCASRVPLNTARDMASALYSAWAVLLRGAPK